jgi:hypothetical protein
MLVMVSAAVFMVYVFQIDVPVYIQRWHQDRGEEKLEFLQGLADLTWCKLQERGAGYWFEEFRWQSLYFLFGVEGARLAAIKLRELKLIYAKNLGVM